MSPFKPLVFSGVQPTGNLHLGNYLGAIKRFVELQDRFDCIYCVVDLHAITVWQEPSELPRAIREVTAAFLACGIDPKKHIVFNQSQVAEHAELAWVFNCVARLGWLNRMTQFKEKAGKDRENASVGLYAYPTLMAAGILIYRATHEPVGEGQKQHLELSRDIAQKFNNDFAKSIQAHGYGDAFFPQPEPLIQGPATRVMSLRDGSKKMSKSDASDQSRINLTDDADAIAHKIRRAKTDPEALPSEEKGLETRPEADNLVGIYAALAGRIRGYLYTLCRNASLAEDLVQDTFVQLHRSRRTYEPGRPVTPWVFAIARHVFLMNRRTTGRRLRVEDTLVAEALHTDRPTWSGHAAS